MKLLLDPATHSALERQRAEALDDEPLRFHGLIDRWARERTGRPACRADVRAVLEPDAVLFTWLPTRSALAAALAGRLVYLHWGFETTRRLKRTVLHTVLRCARAVIVNDPTSAAEVTAITGRAPITAPMFVDADYFAAVRSRTRGCTFFCAGSNDRDPAILAAMANAGFDVVWLCNEPAVAATAVDAAPRLTVISRITSATLRDHYATSAATVTPTIRDVHAAGQTTGLEALASGAPLLLSPGRTAALLGRFPGVRVVHGGPENWIAAARDILASPPSPVILGAAAVAAAAHVAPEAVMAALDEAFAAAGTPPGKKLSQRMRFLASRARPDR